MRRPWFSLRALAVLAVLSASVTVTAADVQPDHNSPVLFGEAPDFPKGLDWLNTARPLTLAELRGKIVLLDFWTYGCINCIHIIPDLERLQKEHADELVVIGVHSAKYTNESQTANIREVIRRYGITHPVVNDRGYQVWDAYGANAWPTLVLIDPSGRIAGRLAGEGVYAHFKPQIQMLVATFSKRGLLNRGRLASIEQRPPAPDSLLSFPGKVSADIVGGRLLIADSSHNRIVIADLKTGDVLDVAGSGAPGLVDGPFSQARFDHPQGMALAADERTLYVADTGNHAIRALDLRDRTVTTFAGTGRQARRYPPQAGPAGSIELSSPWDLALVGDRLFVAMAGSHQVWVANLRARYLEPFAGSGEEGTGDGPRMEASLAQPSGLAWDGKDGLYVASSEGNSIRRVDLGASGFVRTLAGSTDNLFDFGYVDGSPEKARFQHPLGVAFLDGSLYVADTYNSRIRRIDVATSQVTTVAGGTEGWRDGPEPQFFEPGGISPGPDGKLVIADTNNQAVRFLDPSRHTATTFVLKGTARLAFGAADGASGSKSLKAPAVTLAPGKASIRLSISLPQGYKVNPQAPFAMQWSAQGDGVGIGASANVTITNPSFPLDVPFSTSLGKGTLVGQLAIVYCRVDEEGVCLLDRVRIDIPYRVAAGGATSVPVDYAIELPR